MITVEIKINNDTVFFEGFVNVTEVKKYGEYGKGEQLYEDVDGNVLIKHNYEDGAKELAKRIIDTCELLEKEDRDGEES